ncbi:hypothetical protein GQX74_012082 [Glossina fuscipes]|nr:hypothetical protein GQX74_012082 [Glossina fuscipes]
MEKKLYRYEVSANRWYFCEGVVLVSFDKNPSPYCEKKAGGQCMIRLLWTTDRPSQASHSKTKFQLNQNVENVNLTNAINMELSETVERTRTTAIDDFKFRENDHGFN